MFNLVKRLRNRFLPRSSPTATLHPYTSSKWCILDVLIKNRIPISQIIDVGVQAETPELRALFPDVPHLLFEPVSSYAIDIERNYAGIEHQLFPIPLSSCSESAWQVETSILNDGNITHSYISTQPVLVDGFDIVRCRPIRVEALDAFYNLFLPNFLLKIDIDGLELSVIKGASKSLSLASVVVVEADYSSLSARCAAIECHGFQLIEIVDRILYGHVLWQADLVFLRADLVAPVLRPPMFNPEFWRPLT